MRPATILLTLLSITSTLALSLPTIQRRQDVSTSPDAGPAHLDVIDQDQYAVIQRNAPLRAAAHRIRESAIQSDDTPGFAGMRLVDPGVLELWWKGGILPPQVQQAVDAENATLGADNFVVRDAVYDHAELKRAALQMEKMLLDQGNVFHSVAINVDGSGLEVHGDGEKLLPASAIGKRSVDELKVELESSWSEIKNTTEGFFMGIPLTFKSEQPATPTQRWNDQGPIEGGVCITNGNSRCTVGYVIASSATPRRYLLTAAHCGDTTTRWFTCQGNRPVGTVFDRDESIDMMAIVTDQDINGSIWQGPLARNGGTEFLTDVVGYERNVDGEMLCQSGATSGVVCNIRGSASTQRYCYQPNGPCAWVNTGVQLNGVEAARGGDSGGPVYSLTQDGKVVAKGITSGGGQNRILYVPFTLATQKWSTLVLV
ncbi:hypothetical protein HDV05_005025 [Chytridiales sp. JEL 0842]|nr:hypothetical protein HDV05_005025 [Chytridiales sp. JEL 0842]